VSESALYAGNLERFYGQTLDARIAHVVCSHLRMNNFGGRIDIAPETFNRLQEILVFRHEPTFCLTGEPNTGDYRIEMVIAGATVSIHVDPTLAEYEIRAHLRTRPHAG